MTARVDESGCVPGTAWRAYLVVACLVLCAVVAAGAVKFSGPVAVVKDSSANGGTFAGVPGATGRSDTRRSTGPVLPIDAAGAR